MSNLGPARLVGALLAVAAVAAPTTAGIALAQGGHHHARHGRLHHAKASGTGTACPAPSIPPAQRTAPPPGSAAEQEARARKEALAKDRAPQEAPAGKEGPTTAETPAEKEARRAKEALAAAGPTPCPGAVGDRASRGG